MNKELGPYLDQEQLFYLNSGSPAPLDANLVSSMVDTVIREINTIVTLAQSLAKFYNFKTSDANSVANTDINNTWASIRTSITTITTVGAEAIRVREALRTGAETLNKDMTSIKNLRFKLRFFPSNVNLGYPGLQFNTSIVSGSKMLQVTGPRSLFSIQLMNCLALNTLDTQWVDLYATFFEHWISTKKNPLVNLQIGEYLLDECLLTTPPVLNNRLEVAEAFSLQFLSQHTSIDKLRPVFPSNPTR